MAKKTQTRMSKKGQGSKGKSQKRNPGRGSSGSGQARDDQGRFSSDDEM